MPKKYEVTEVFTQEKRDEMLREIRQSANSEMKNIPYGTKEYDAILNDLVSYKSSGIDILETIFIGPFTAKEYLTEIGVKLDEVKLSPASVYGYIKALEKRGAYKLDRKDLGDGKSTFVFSEFTTEEMNKLKQPGGKDQLTMWDKFCGLFGYKTEHARSVELSSAGLEAIQAKQKELYIKLLKEKRDALVKKHAEAHVENKKLLSATKIMRQGWSEIFFGDEEKSNKKVPPYILDNGKKVSALSLCMAVLQQNYGNDLSATNPIDFAKEMEKNEKLKERVKIIGDVIKDMAKKSAGKKFMLVSELLTAESKLRDLDPTLKGILKPGDKTKAIDVTTAAEYKGMSSDQKAKDEGVETLAQAGIMFSMKEDMLKVFDDKNDPIYSMKDDQGNPKNPAAAEVEHHAKASLKAAVLYEAIQKENYDMLLKAAGFGDDYSKIDDAFQLAEDMINEASKGVVVKSKEEINENKIEEIDFDDEHIM